MNGMCDPRIPFFIARSPLLIYNFQVDRALLTRKEVDMGHKIRVEIHKKGLFGRERIEYDKRRIDNRKYDELVKAGRIIDDTMIVTEDELSMFDMFIIDEIMDWQD